MKTKHKNVIRIYLVVISLFLSSNVLGKIMDNQEDTLNNQTSELAYEQRSTVQFIQNKGQVYDDKGEFRKDVDFLSGFPGGTIYFTDKGLVYYYYTKNASKFDKIKSGKTPNPYSQKEWDKIKREVNKGTYKGKLTQSKSKSYRVDMTFPGADLSHPVATEKIRRENNYFIPEKEDEIKNVPIFKRIKYLDAYPGIDLVFYKKKGQIKYNFEAHPKADISQIKVLYKGQKNISIDKEGNAVIDVLPGQIIEETPISFQDNRKVKTSFKLNGDTLGFKIDNYDTNRHLSIDPALNWSTHFYNNALWGANGTTRPVWDSQGNMFVVYTAYDYPNKNFPTIDPGGSAYYIATPNNTGNDNSLVIMKFNPDREIVWATYYTSDNEVKLGLSNQALAIDQDDNIYIIGRLHAYPGSNNSIVFSLKDPGGGAFFEPQIANDRPFLLKFKNTGERLWATMLDANDSDNDSGLQLSGIATDQNNNLYVTGTSYAPTTNHGPIPLKDPGGGAYYNGNPTESQTPVLFEFDSSCKLKWGTYISGGAIDSYNGYGSRIATDQNNNIFLVTGVDEFPNITDPGGGAYQDNTPNSFPRKFLIVKFNNDKTMYWSTMFGGTAIQPTGGYSYQNPTDIITTSSGDLFVVGYTNTSDFPIVDPGGGAYTKSTTFTDNSNTDGVIAKFSNNGVLNWSTYLTGGTDSKVTIHGIAKNQNDDIVIAGGQLNQSPVNFPTKNETGSYNQSSISSDFSAILAKFDENGVRKWATYFGDELYFASVPDNGSDGGFGGRNFSNAKDCNPEGQYVMLGTLQTGSGTIPTENPGGGAYFEGSPETSTNGTDFIAEFIDGESNATLPNASASAVEPTICEGEDIELQGSGGGTYIWSGSGITSSNEDHQNVTISNADIGDGGDYILEVENSNGCKDKDTVTIIVNPKPTSNATSNSPICEGENIELNAGNVSGATYSWSGPGSYSSSSQNPIISGASNSDEGSYTLTTTKNGCSREDNVNIVVNPNPNASASSNSPICVGDDINLTASGVSGATYSWSGPGGYSNSSQNPTITTASSSDGGAYTLTVTNNGCSSDDNINIVVNPNPTANATSNSPICVGDDINLTASGVSGATYSWSGPGSYSSSNQNPTITTASSSDGGTYTLTVTNNSCSSENTVSVVVNPKEDASFTYSPNTICIGSSNVSPIISGASGGTFTTSNSDLVIDANTGEIDMTNTIAGTYDITYTTSGTCFSSETHSVTITASPDATFSYPNSVYCQDEGIVAPNFPSGASGGTFTSSNGLELNQNNGEIDFSQSTPGTYTITNNIAASGVCPANTADYDVTVKENPSVTVNIASSSSLCPGSTLDLEASGAGSGGSYSWTGPEGYNSTDQNPSISNADTTASGYYTVTIEDSEGCSNTDSVNVNIVDNTAPTFNNGCIEDTTLNLSNASCETSLPDFTSSNQLDITDNCGNMSSNSLTIIQNPSAGTTLDIGTHTIWIIASDNSNNLDSCSFNITVEDTISPSFNGGCLDDTTLTANTASCNIQLPDFINGNTDLNSITDNCSELSDSSITLAQNPLEGTVLAPGKHTVWIVATDANGNLDSCSFIVTVDGELPELPVLSANSYSICLGSAVTMQVDNPDSNNGYSWHFNGQEVGTEPSYEITSALNSHQGLYILTAQSPNGCKADTSVFLTVKPCGIDISGAISPNGDGKNDNFVIDGIEGYPNTEVWIYNRWGTEVYHSDDYQNNWKGTSQSSLNIGGNQLPEGTYYYIIKLGGKEGVPNAGEEYTGYVYIKI